MVQLLLLIVAVFFQLGIAAPRYPFIKILTPKQRDRLLNWKVGDKQDMWELSGQFEGDMVLLASQKNGLLDRQYHWKNREIPYQLDPIFDQNDAEWIRKSLKQYETDTCLIIRERNPDDEDYIYITGLQAGCWSVVGRKGGKQLLNLQRNSPGSGCFETGTIIHEFLHAAGFFHQHSAANRGEYVRINWENLEKDDESNFQKEKPNTTSSSHQLYDYGSIMHYGPYAFSKNDEKTIQPLDPHATIGQRYQMSVTDINKIKLMYCPQNEPLIEVERLIQE